MARVANSGISAFINPDGSIISNSLLGEKTFILTQFEKKSYEPSPFSHYSFIYLSIIILISFITARIFI